MFFGLVTKHTCDRRTDRRTDGRTERQNYDSQYRASIAASRGKNGSPYYIGPLSVCPAYLSVPSDCMQRWCIVANGLDGSRYET